MNHSTTPPHHRPTSKRLPLHNEYQGKTVTSRPPSRRLTNTNTNSHRSGKQFNRNPDSRGHQSPTTNHRHQLRQTPQREPAAFATGIHRLMLDIHGANRSLHTSGPDNPPRQTTSWSTAALQRTASTCTCGGSLPAHQHIGPPSIPQATAVRPALASTNTDSSPRPGRYHSIETTMLTPIDKKRPPVKRIDKLSNKPSSSINKSIICGNEDLIATAFSNFSLSRRQRLRDLPIKSQ